jgi:transcriptional antiterminator RfaH
MMKLHEPIAGLGNADQLNWGVIQAAGGREHIALESCGSLGLRAYLPRYVKREKSGSRPISYRDVLKPLFPGYLFFAWSPLDRSWTSLYRKMGIIAILTTNESPRPISYDLLCAIAGAEERCCGLYKRDKRFWPFKEGDLVRVSEGSFSGFYAQLIKLDDGGRISLLLDAFGRKSELKGLTVEHIEAV